MLHLSGAAESDGVQDATAELSIRSGAVQVVELVDVDL
jgi:hypothetical protein